MTPEEKAQRQRLRNGILICSHRNRDGKICGREPVRYFKHLKIGLYIGFCEEHKNQYPEEWSTFKPVPKEEVIIYEVMRS